MIWRCLIEGLVKNQLFYLVGKINMFIMQSIAQIINKVDKN